MPTRHRRDQLRVAADERAVLDDRLVLVHAVVVAGDRAGADVDVCADRRVAEVGQVIDLRPGAERGLLQLDEVADLGAFADRRSRAADARTDRWPPRLQRAHQRCRQKLLIVTWSPISESTMRTWA